MSPSQPLILGEFRRTIDDRYRLSVPAELIDALAVVPPEGASEVRAECILAKERPGALSLWNALLWTDRLQSSIHLVEAKIQAGRLERRIEDVQHLGRLLSTRHRTVGLAGRSRVVIPEGFREFLDVEPGGEVILVGAALCIEIWRPAAWLAYLQQRMPDFGNLLNELSG